MGVAGSKATETDAIEEGPATRGSRGEPVAASHMPTLESGHGVARGTKRHQTIQTTSQGLKKRKAAAELSDPVPFDLAFRSPRQIPDGGTASTAAYAPSTGIDKPRGVAVSGQPPQSENYSTGTATPEPIPLNRQAILASPEFRHTLKCLRQGSEDVPSGWAIAMATPVSQSQRQHNLTMVRKAVVSLQDIHLTSTYRKESLQRSTTSAPGHTTSRSRIPRRASLQPSGMAALKRLSGVIRIRSASLGAVTTKRPRAEEHGDSGRSSKRVKKTHDEDGRMQLAKRHVRKLGGLWRKDEWAGWTGLLKREF